MKQTDTVDVLIVGGGFSTMPLIRELDASGISWLMISEMTPIWKRLEDADALEFDLVSSLFSSIYSFELVEMMRDHDGMLKDGFPTARDYYAIHKKYAERYADNILIGHVDKIDNHADHSIVHVADGRHIRAQHVVVATAFRRKMNATLADLKIDQNMAGKSVAITSTGDSANMIIAQLIGFGAKVHLITNGFIALDKMFVTFSPLDPGGRYNTMDQFEVHNLAEISRWGYRALIDGGYVQGMIRPTFAKLMDRDSMSVRHPLSNRPQKEVRNFFGARAPIENGHITVKHWPIDTYRRYFGEHLEDRISEGYLLNDLPFFVDQGLVKLWDKKTTQIDRDAKQLSDGDSHSAFDMIIDGGPEEPAIPPIHRHGEAEDAYIFKQRETWLGVVPPTLNNIYMIGFTRPFTGGINNVSEMQCLLAHRMISEPEFRSEMHSEIDQRITKYNHRYYANRPPKPTDHLVYYGNYTDEVARALDIRPSVRDARSAYDLIKYYMFPNNVFYFRETGRYKVEGVDQLIRMIAKHHHDYSILMLLCLRYPAFELLALGTIAFAPIPWWIKPFAAAAHIMLPFTAVLLGKLGLPAYDSKLIFNYRKATSFPVLAYPLVVAVTWAIGGTTAAFALSAGLLIYVYAMIHIGSAKGWNRKFFCDMQSKRAPKNVRFFEKYLEVFRRVKGG